MNTIKRHKIVSAGFLILEKDGKVLLSRRSNTGYRDGEYGLISGHTENMETLADTIIREAFEEAGILVAKEDIRLVYVLSRLSEFDGEQRVDFFWQCSQWKGEIINKEVEKCSDLSWFDKTALPDDIIPYVKKVIETKDQGIKYSEVGW